MTDFIIRNSYKYCY